MTVACAERSRRAVLVLALLACPALALALPPAIVAKYEFERNGKVLGEAETAHSVTGAGWQVTSHSKGTQGSARLLGFEESSGSSGDWLEALPRPRDFVQQVRVATMDRQWTADFDWAAGTVLSVHKDGESRLDLQPGTLDPLAVALRIRIGLSNGERHWQFPLLDEEEIDAAEFRAYDEERLDTALGCLVTRRVEKIRAPDSKRYTRTWYARDHGWAPVRVEHGKTGGNHMETRILSLAVDGRPVLTVPACDGN